MPQTFFVFLNMLAIVTQQPLVHKLVDEAIHAILTFFFIFCFSLP